VQAVTVASEISHHAPINIAPAAFGMIASEARFEGLRAQAKVIEEILFLFFFFCVCVYAFLISIQFFFLDFFLFSPHSHLLLDEISCEIV
jgi:hypothetical protein